MIFDAGYDVKYELDDIGEDTECEPLLSIIVPVYNIENYLERCVESVIRQTYRNLQIILVDDGSTDSSGHICEKYALKDKRIFVIHKRNGGSVSARKAGLRSARGEFIGFVDGDDYIEPEMFERLYIKIAETDADFVHSGFKKNGKNIFSPEKSDVYYLDEKNRVDFYKNHIFDSTYPQYISPSMWSKLFKKATILKSFMDLPERQQYGEDLLCLCNCVRYSAVIAVMSDTYYHYTVRDSSLSQKKDFAALEQSYQLYHCLRGLFENFQMSDAMSGTIEKYVMREIAGVISGIGERNVAQYAYPDVASLFDRKIVIFGAGKVGYDYYSQICMYSRCHIVAWADNNRKNYTYDFCDVIGTEEMIDRDFDLVIIAVSTKNTADLIKKGLVEKGVESGKILWRRPRLL